MIFVGVDAGGSHTEAVAVDQTGRVVARVRGGPAIVSPDRITEAATHLADVVSGLLQESGVEGPIEGLCIGAAGAGRESERDALQQAFGVRKLAGHIRVTTDGDIALESAFPETPGIVLVAGTGSVAFARDANGNVHRAGGLGWRLGDEGSGYALGRAALAATGKVLDGRGRASALTEAVLAVAGVTDLDGLVRWSQAADRARIAELAEGVSVAAATGDAEARELVDAAAGELVALVVALLARVGTPAPEQVALSGGLLAPGSAVRDSVVATLSRAVPQLTLSRAPLDPALGAARLARRL